MRCVLNTDDRADVFRRVVMCVFFIRRLFESKKGKKARYRAFSFHQNREIRELTDYASPLCVALEVGEFLLNEFRRTKEPTRAA